MKAIGKGYFEIPVNGLSSGETVRVWRLGKGRNARIVTSAGGRLTSIPLVRASSGSLKRLRATNEIEFNPFTKGGWRNDDSPGSDTDGIAFNFKAGIPGFRPWD